MSALRLGDILIVGEERREKKKRRAEKGEKRKRSCPVPVLPSVKTLHSVSWLSSIPHLNPRHSKIFVVCLQIIKIEIRLPVAQDEGQEGEDEGIQDSHDGQHVGPAYRAIAQGVFSCLLPAHVPDHLSIPSIGEDHATQHQAHSAQQLHPGAGLVNGGGVAEEE